MPACLCLTHLHSNNNATTTCRVHAQRGAAASACCAQLRPLLRLKTAASRQGSPASLSATKGTDTHRHRVIKTRIHAGHKAGGSDLLRRRACLCARYVNFLPLALKRPAAADENANAKRAWQRCDRRRLGTLGDAPMGRRRRHIQAYNLQTSPPPPPRSSNMLDRQV